MPIASVLLTRPGVCFLPVLFLTRKLSYSRSPDRGSTCSAQTLLSGPGRGRADALETSIRSIRRLEGSRPTNNHLGREQKTEKTEREKARD